LHIALSFDHSRQFFRDLWDGVQEYALHRRNWNIVLRSPAGIRDWSFAGLITYSTRREEARTWLSIGPPVVASITVRVSRPSSRTSTPGAPRCTWRSRTSSTT